MFMEKRKEERQSQGAFYFEIRLGIHTGPIVAGIVQMDKKKFTFYNVVGSFTWVFSMLLAGHFLQKWILSQFGFDLKEHLEVIVLGIVLVTTAPVLAKMIVGSVSEKK